MPVGLIHYFLGGTNVESWISGKVLQEMPDFSKVVEDIRAMPDKVAMKADYLKALELGTIVLMKVLLPGNRYGLRISLDDKA